MPALQRGAACADERPLGALRQPVAQNGRVHLHIIDFVHLPEEKRIYKIEGGLGLLH